jgi:hypothetical protein
MEATMSTQHQGGPRSKRTFLDHASVFGLSNLLAFLLLLYPGSALAVSILINFDSLSVPVALSTQFAAQGVVFNSGLADNNTFGAQVVVPSSPNYVRFGDGFTITFVDPANSAVNATTDFVSYENLGLHSGGQYDGYTVSVRNLLGVEIGTFTVPPEGPGAEIAPFPTSFSIAGIHSLVFSRTTNPLGSGIVGFDDLQFNAVTAVRAVPEPASGLLLVGGLAGLGLLRRRVARYR